MQSNDVLSVVSVQTGTVLAAGLADGRGTFLANRESKRPINVTFALKCAQFEIKNLGIWRCSYLPGIIWTQDTLGAGEMPMSMERTVALTQTMFLMCEALRQICDVIGDNPEGHDPSTISAKAISMHAGNTLMALIAVFGTPKACCALKLVPTTDTQFECQFTSPPPSSTIFEFTEDDVRQMSRVAVSASNRAYSLDDPQCADYIHVFEIPHGGYFASSIQDGEHITSFNLTTCSSRCECILELCSVIAAWREATAQTTARKSEHQLVWERDHIRISTIISTASLIAHTQTLFPEGVGTSPLLL